MSHSESERRPLRHVRTPDRSQPLEGKERLHPGEKLLLAGPFSLLVCAVVKSKGEEMLIAEAPGREIDSRERKAMMNLLYEYSDIYKLLTRLVSEKNVVIGRTCMVLGKRSGDGVTWVKQTAPQEADLKEINIPFLDDVAGVSWPRDAYTIIGNRVYANERRWKPEHLSDLRIVVSPLGESGKVLYRKNVVLVTEELLHDSQLEIARLRDEGNRVTCLPFVKHARQKDDFAGDHLDGHAALVESEKGELVLLVAESYLGQSKETRQAICSAAKGTGCQLENVYDPKLPPLALNLIQLADGSVVVTRTDSGILEKKLAMIVGRDKVFSTQKPLVNIPRMTTGSLRCLTNILPDFLVVKLPITSN